MELTTTVTPRAEERLHEERSCLVVGRSPDRTTSWTAGLQIVARELGDLRSARWAGRRPAHNMRAPIWLSAQGRAVMRTCLLSKVPRSRAIS